VSAKLPFVPASTIAIISDTHLPRGYRELPAACVARLRAADLIIHAGDLITAGILEQMRAFGEVVAVHGNVDGAAVRALLPDRLELTLGDVRVGVVHDAGPAKGRLQRLRRSFTEADAVIFGHSHIPLLERDPSSSFQIFNPGSPTDKRRQPGYTMGWGQIKSGELSFEIVDLGR